MKPQARDAEGSRPKFLYSYAALLHYSCSTFFVIGLLGIYLSLHPSIVISIVLVHLCCPMLPFHRRPSPLARNVNAKSIWENQLNIKNLEKKKWTPMPSIKGTDAAYRCLNWSRVYNWFLPIIILKLYSSIYPLSIALNLAKIPLQLQQPTI